MTFYRKKILILSFLCAFSVSALAQYDFNVNVTEGCTPLKVKYTFVSSALVDTIDTYYWDFGNGQTSNLPDPDTIVYNNAGAFTPTLVLNNRTDLMIIKPDLLTVHRTVQADFRYYDTVSYYTYVFEHADILDNTATYDFLWNFEDVGTRTGQIEIVTFPRIDSFQVSLTVNDNFGCTSTVSKLVIILENIKVQNVFTPNGDNINDFFMISSNGSYPLNLKIFTRSGVLVYENEGFTITWDGRTASGQELNSGVYFYVLKALAGDPSDRYNKSGVLYLYK
ncbi:MAG: gliding motility-associated C-terminal domain-containing protein [Bacteroidales bacterium]|nr:gliding motility-associated C-terminal domain-containing protein [Bacteroidales bacterium]